MPSVVTPLRLRPQTHLSRDVVWRKRRVVTRAMAMDVGNVEQALRHFVSYQTLFENIFLETCFALATFNSQTLTVT